MGKTVLSDGLGSERSWKDTDVFVGHFVNRHTVNVAKGGKKKDLAPVLSFITSRGMLERWSTTLWERLIKEKALKVGDVLSVEAKKETRSKGSKNRFRPFSIVKLTKKDIPKSLR